MYASVTIASTTTEIRPLRTVGSGDEQRTIRVRPGRGNARRTAIRDSWGAGR